MIVTVVSLYQNVAGFLGYPQPGGGTHPPIPREGVFGKVLGKHTRTHDLEWFGPPERNTLHPLGEVLMLVVYESILCRVLAFTQPEFSSSGRPLL